VTGRRLCGYRERVNSSAAHVRADPKIASRAIMSAVRRVKIALNRRPLQSLLRADLIIAS